MQAARALSPLSEAQLDTRRRECVESRVLLLDSGIEYVKAYLKFRQKALAPNSRTLCVMIQDESHAALTDTGIVNVFINDQLSKIAEEVQKRSVIIFSCVS